MKPVSLTVSMLPACSLERYFLCSLSKAEDFPDGSDGKESICNAGDPDLRRDRQPIPVFLGFPGGSDGKESTCNAGDLGSSTGLGRSPEEGNGYHSSILISRIPFTEQPDRLHSMGSQRARYD